MRKLRFFPRKCHVVLIIIVVVNCYKHNVYNRFCFSLLIVALDLGIHIAFPFHWPSLFSSPFLITASCGHLCLWIKDSADEIEIFKVQYLLKGKSEFDCELWFPFSHIPSFIFKNPLRNNWTLVLLVSPIHTHLCFRPLHQSGVFKAVRLLFIIVHSDLPRSSLRSDGEELRHNYLIRLLQETMSGGLICVRRRLPQQPASLTVRLIGLDHRTRTLLHGTKPIDLAAENIFMNMDRKEKPFLLHCSYTSANVRRN